MQHTYLGLSSLRAAYLPFYWQTLKECKLEDGGIVALIYKKSADVRVAPFPFARPIALS